VDSMLELNWDATGMRIWVVVGMGSGICCCWLLRERAVRWLVTADTSWTVASEAKF